AEDEHQDYYKKQTFHYRLDEKGSGREDFINKYWEKQHETKEVKNRLTAIQYHVTKEKGTEPPLQDEYWDNEDEGIYVDFISGKVLFSSKEQYDAGCG